MSVRNHSAVAARGSARRNVIVRGGIRTPQQRDSGLVARPGARWRQLLAFLVTGGEEGHAANRYRV